MNVKRSQPLNTPSTLLIHFSYYYTNNDNKEAPDNKQIIREGKVKDFKKRPVKEKHPKKEEEEPYLLITHY
jgi:hypothetical protein